MPAAPPGTVSLSCTTEAGVLTVTVHYDPGTGAFNPDALTATGVGSGTLRFILTGEGPVSLPITAGSIATADTLAGAGVAGWFQAHSLTLTVLDAP